MSASIIIFSYRNFWIGALYTYFSRIKEKKIQDAIFAGKKTAIGVHAMYVHSIFFQGEKKIYMQLYGDFFFSTQWPIVQSLRSIVTISKNKIILAY